MLNAEKIKRVYGNSRGLHEFSLKVYEGEVLSLVGPNGSGKTTAINIIAGIALSDDGKCQINGIDTYKNEAKKIIGYLEEEAFYYDGISIENYLNLIWSMKFASEVNNDLVRLLRVFGLADIRNSKLGSLSMGMRKRVGIISAIMNHPPLIILDEPTNSIDTEGLIIMKDELAKLRDAGSAIILSGHVLDFLKTVSTKYIFLKDGFIVKEIENTLSLDLDAVYRSIYNI
jgi:ABC-type multidrug transport system ATPase subunit